MAEFSNQTKTDIIIAASVIAGKGATETEVTAEVSKIIARFEQGSMSLYAFERAEKQAAITTDVKSFRATIIGLDKEVSTQRGIIYLKTRPSEHAPDGKEFSRSERVDSPEGRALMREVQQLIGHKVLITLAIEKTGSGKKARVARAVQDLGVDTDYNAQDPAFQPSYDKLDTSKLVSHGAKDEPAAA